MSDLTIRHISGPEELELFGRLAYVLDDELEDDLAEGRRRPSWMWLALRGDHVVARMAFWGRPDDDEPRALDFFDLCEEDEDRLEVGMRLLETAAAKVLADGTPPPDYSRFVPPDWHDEPAARRIVEDRLAVLERLGAELFVERLRLEWSPGTEIAPRSGRLTFRPVSGRDELVALMTPVLEGTLDAYSREDLARMTPEEAAAQQYDEEFADYDSPQQWWTVGELPDGTPVGFVIPARNMYHAIIAYVGVLPAHRGNGYIDELLAEGTRILAAEDVPRIRAATDVGNVPMAKAFERAGYVDFQRSLILKWR